MTLHVEEQHWGKEEGSNATLKFISGPGLTKPAVLVKVASRRLIVHVDAKVSFGRLFFIICCILET